MPAVKVTEVPEQIAPEGLATIFIIGEMFGFTTMAMLFEVAEVGEAQIKLEVILTVTRSPFARVVVVNVGEFAPTFTPLIFH